MANPQPDQFTRLSNELLEALMFYPFGGIELRIVLSIFRATYGWNKKLAYMSYGYISRMTNIGRRDVIRACQQLAEKNIITVSEGSAKFRTNKIGIKKDYELWSDFPVDNFRECWPASGSNATRVVGEMTLSKASASGSNATTDGGSNATPLKKPKDNGFKESHKDRENRPVNNGEKLKAQIIGLIKGKEEQLKAGADPREVVCAVSAAGRFELERVWGTIVQARAKRNPPGYLVSALANPKYAVADGALATAKQEMRKFNF